MPPATAAQDPAAEMTPRALTKQEFGRRLQRLMLERNWNQSDLARAAFGKGKDGFPLGRDSISTYVRGIRFPDPTNLKKLADAFGMEPYQLLPNTIEAAIDQEVPALEIKQAAGHPDKVWLRVNQMVDLATAAKVFDALNQKRGGDD